MIKSKKKSGLWKFVCSLVSISLVTTTLAKANRGEPTVNVLVLFQSDHGGTFKLASAIKKGIEKFNGATATLKQVSVPDDKSSIFKSIPLANSSELKNYDAIAFGSPVHFGNMSASMRSFLDQTVPLWTSRALEGIPATVFMSAGSGAGREAAILSFWNTLALHGMIIVPTGIMGGRQDQ